uniref:Uncharacterized protein n=1 Tax=Panagrolaimus sp. ES5 TaxID=591445 RepID=A0AC34FZ26_9BILA
MKSLNIFDEKVKNKLNEDSSSANSSTLSLHIAAYENSAEGNDTVSDGKNEGKEKIIGLHKKWKNAKQLFTDLSSTLQNPFEFPRQKRGGRKSNDREVMQFKASQRLQNPNESTGR